MQSSTEKKLVYYTAFFIALLLNVYKFLALREGAILAQYWHFNGYELIFEFVWNFLFCVIIAFLNFGINALNKKIALKILLFIFCNAIVFALANMTGIAVQKRLFLNATPYKIFNAGYSVRMFSSLVLMAVLVKIMLLMRENNAKKAENEHLRNAYLNAQLELLKEELNPHFFFNALSSLSAIVREDAKQAQLYITHLSKIFRYTLNRHEKNLVALKDELSIFESYAAVLKMRMEDGLIININIPQQYLNYRLPYMSLQPLLENATKHNAASVEDPLSVKIFIEDDLFVIKNNLQPSAFKAESTGIGLANLNERFRILLQKEIIIEKNDTAFTVKLPLQPA